MDPIETMILSVFTGTLGSTLAIGLVCILFFIILGVTFRLSTGAFLIMLFPLVFALAMYGALPQVVLYSLLLGCAFIIFMAVMVVLRR